MCWAREGRLCVASGGKGSQRLSFVRFRPYLGHAGTAWQNTAGARPGLDARPTTEGAKGRKDVYRICQSAGEVGERAREASGGLPRLAKHLPSTPSQSAIALAGTHSHPAVPYTSPS